MISVEKMEQIALKRRERNKQRRYKSAIRRIDKEIRKAYNKGETDMIDCCDYDLLEDLQNYYESKGFFVRKYHGLGHTKDHLHLVWGDYEYHKTIDDYSKKLYEQNQEAIKSLELKD